MQSFFIAAGSRAGVSPACEPYLRNTKKYRKKPGRSPGLGGMGRIPKGQGIRPHQSPLALRGSYSLPLVRLTHVCAFVSCWEGNRTLCPASNSGGYLGVTISPQE
jgi:hypothetical protein